MPRHHDGREAWTVTLLRWYRRSQRAMPWRSDPSPYRVWLSEIMLQQTQVRTVIPYYERFLRRFPDVAALAAAPLDAVLKAWEGLGYYSRARNLHHAARVVVARHGGCIPRAIAELKALPGVGDYTAAAVASICFGTPAPVVDGNVLRVSARFWSIRQDVRLPRTRRLIAARLAASIPQAHPGDFNQAMMELGALLCRPRSPDCPNCPLRRWCAALASREVDRLPVRSAAKAVPHRVLVAAVVRRRGLVLIARRRDDGLLGGLWEFPCVERRGGPPVEPVADAAVRAAREVTGVEVSTGVTRGVVRHAYSHFRVTVHACEYRWLSGRPRPLDCALVRWVDPAQLEPYAFTNVARRILALAAPPSAPPAR